MTVRSLFSRKIRFNITVVTGVLVIVCVMAFSTVGMILSAARHSAQESAENQFGIISLSSRERTVSFLQPAMDLSTISAFIPEIGSPVEGNGLTHPVLLLFTRMLLDRQALYSSYVGFDDGTFFQVIKARQNDPVIEAHGAPEKTDMIVRTITGQGDERVQTFTFLDMGGAVIAERKETEFDYDPRVRPWYTEAMKYPEAVLTEPYIFNSLKKPGITAAFALPGKAGVIGVDLTISTLLSFVSSQKISANGGTALLTEDMEVIAASPGIESILEDIAGKGENPTGLFENTETIQRNGLLLRAEKWKIAPNMGLYIFSSAPLSDFMAGAIELQRKILLLSSIILLVTIPFVVFWSRRLSRALKELTRDAEKVGQLIFDGELTVKTPIYEFHQLACGFEVMKSTIAKRTEKLKETLAKLEMLVDMVIALSAEFDINRLSEMILSGAKRLTNADGGSLYLVSSDKQSLDFQIVLNETLGFKQGGAGGDPIRMRPVPLYDAGGGENHHNVVTHTFHTGTMINIADAYDTEKYDFSGTREFDRENKYRSVSFLTVPLKPRGGGDILGAFQLINCIDPKTGKITEFPERWHSFVEALSSAAAVAVQNWKLMEAEKKLFNDLVRFVASAIDAKSPYTAKHCERVSALADIIVREANKAADGPFADFQFDTPDKRREFDIAAWLHDCGKITTPEYIVDKATKLETIYNRIHEIRTRFEVLLRDARILRHETVLNGGDSDAADRDLAKKESQLHDDFAFVAGCNIGSEFMEDKKLERLKKIAATPWLRHFDNRLGLSWIEINRLSTASENPEKGIIPVEELLIGDRPEHIIMRDDRIREKYEKLGFTLEIPDHLYNRGELYNLSIRKGTLTLEERFKIDEHAAQTVIMLQQLDFPDSLKRVPDYAGRHHERTDGSGYPRGLDSGRLSIPEKIIAISDIFEALTSSERPYKKANTLSEAIELLYMMKNEGLVDSDLFRLLLVSGAYKYYADIFIEPSRIDKIDISKYLT